jgi:hypothetical protein
MSKPNHPYKQYEGEPIWRVVDKAVRELTKNGDIQETTPRKYIVGYLCEKLSKADLLAPKIISSHRRNGSHAGQPRMRASA